MRFDDRVTGDVTKFAKQAKVIHIEIDAVEINKVVKTEVGILTIQRGTDSIITTCK